MEKLDLKESRLVLEGDKKQQAEWNKRIDDRASYLKEDQQFRRGVYSKRFDFYRGDHANYTNIIGLSQKQKKGHANAAINYAGKTTVKIGYSLANNPPNITIPARKVSEKYVDIERSRAQGVEDFQDEVFKENQFWKSSYRRACFNQVLSADAAIKIYPCNKGTKDNPVWSFKIVNYEKMENLLVGWRSDDPTKFDYVIAEDYRSIQSIFDEFGVKVPDKMAEEAEKNKQIGGGGSGHSDNKQWESGAGANSLPTGANKIPTVKVQEYDDENVYALRIAGELVQLVFKDGKTAPKLGYWVIIHNIPNPGSPWSISDIDYVIDPQIELNEASNEERTYIRVGANQKYVAYNMNEFDPESVKTGSGGVIFVDSPDGSSRFEPLPTNVNTFPIDTYIDRQQKFLYDLGLPKVSYGSTGGDSGRSKAIDYQTMVDLVVFKRDAWELALDQLSEKIQILGDFYFGDMLDIFKDPMTGQRVIRHPEFDWTDILPVTQGDKVVSIVNKVQMGLPFSIAFKELGYRDVDAVLAEIRRESADPALMTYRSHMWQLTQGIVQAQQQAMATTGTTDMTAGGATPDPNQAGAILSTAQNDGRSSSLPMAQTGGTTAYSSPQGAMAMKQQNMAAMRR